MTELIIDKEFHDLIPPLTKEEYDGLEESILKEGCRDALTVWDNTLIDGHNRYQICSNHNKAFEINKVQFDSRDSAKEWIIKNQFGRRNLSAYNRSILALKLKDIFAEKAKANQGKRTDLTSVRNLTNVDTKKELAKLAGTSHNTIFEVEVIEKEGTPEIKEQLKKKEISIHNAYKTIRGKEDKPVKPQLPIKKEVEKKSAEPAEIVIESIFSISRFEKVVNQFICEINPLSMGHSMFANMDFKTRQDYIDQINLVKKWFNKIELIINGGEINE